MSVRNKIKYVYYVFVHVLFYYIKHLDYKNFVYFINKKITKLLFNIIV